LQRYILGYAMKETQHECPLRERCDLVFDECVKARVEYTTSLEEVTASRDYWQDQALKALRALMDIGVMVDVEEDEMPMHVSVPAAVRMALGE
jgi:hypothetical protein